MDNIDPVKRSENIFTLYPATVDLGVSLLSGGLVTLFPVIGMTDHLSKSQVGCATLLNTTFLLIGNKLGKTALRESSYYRIGITLTTLASSFFTARYLAPLLKVNISSRATLLISVTHLVVKGGASLVYNLALCLMSPSSRRQSPPPPKPQPQGQQVLPELPINTQAIAQLTKETLDLFHDWFQTEEGKGKWKSFDGSYKLAFLSQLHGNKNPIKDYELNSNEIDPPQFNTYKDLLWSYVGNKFLNLDNERLEIVHRLFIMDQSAWNRLIINQKLSFIAQLSTQGIPITTYVDDFGFCEEIWSSFPDISKLDELEIKIIHNFLLTNRGIKKWETIPPSLQLHLLCAFRSEGLQFPPLLNIERLNNEDIKNYHDFIWMICDFQDKKRLDRDQFKIEVTSLFERCFCLDYPPPSPNIQVPYQTFDMGKLEKFFLLEIGTHIPIDKLTKNQLSWLGAIGQSIYVSSMFMKLTPEVHSELMKKLKSQFGMFYMLIQ